MFLAVFRFLDINALDFRSKAGKLINAFYKCTLGSTANTTTYKYINTCFGQK